MSRRKFLDLAIVGGTSLLLGCSSVQRNIEREILDDASLHTLVLDFDGTLTNIEEEAKGYAEGFCNGLGRELGLSQGELETYWNEARTKVLRNPEKYGWELEGIIVASATSDPIVICNPIADEIFAKLGRTFSQKERRALFGKLYLQNYQKMSESFKEGADDFLVDVYNLFEGRVYIVTNSSVGNVRKKMSHLPSDHSRIPIIGGAKKYVIVNSLETIPETEMVLGLERPVFLRRQYYGEILDRIMQEQKIDAQRIAVVGDIWELDLALPQYLGMSIGFMPHQTTPQFERDVVANYRRGFISDILEEVYKNLNGRIK